MNRSFLGKILTIVSLLILSVSLVSCSVTSTWNSFLNWFKKMPTNESIVNSYEEISIIAGLEKYFSPLETKVFSIQASDYIIIGNKFAAGQENNDIKNNLTSMLYLSEYSAIGFGRFYPLFKSNFFKNDKGKPILTKDEAITLTDDIKNFKTHLTALDIELEIIRQRADGSFDPVLGSDQNILSKIKTELNGIIDANLSLSHTTLSAFNRILAEKEQTITKTSTAVIRGSLEADALLDFTSVLSVYNNLFVKKYQHSTWFNTTNTKNKDFGEADTSNPSAANYFDKTNLVFSLADKIQSVKTTAFEKAESTANFAPAVRDEYFALKQTVGMFFPLVDSINKATAAFPFDTLKEKVIERYGSDKYTDEYVELFINNQKPGVGLGEYIFEADYNVSAVNTEQYKFIKNVFENNFVNGIYNPLIKYFNFIATNFNS